MQKLSKAARKQVRKERRTIEKRDMNKAFKMGLIYLSSFFISLLFIVTACASETLEVTYYAKSHHFQYDLPYNEEHQFIGLELRNDIRGYGIARFKNSYRVNSIMLTYSRYWQPYKNIELNLTGGIATGYDKLVRCRVKGAYLCPIFSGGVTYTKYKYFKPRISLFGGAFVLSISGEY